MAIHCRAAKNSLRGTTVLCTKDHKIRQMNFAVQYTVYTESVGQCLLKVKKFWLWRTMTVCYVTLSLTPSGLTLCQIVKTVYKT